MVFAFYLQHCLRWVCSTYITKDKTLNFGRRFEAIFLKRSVPYYIAEIDFFGQGKEGFKKGSKGLNILYKYFMKVNFY